MRTYNLFQRLISHVFFTQGEGGKITARRVTQKASATQKENPAGSKLLKRFTKHHQPPRGY